MAVKTDMQRAIGEGNVPAVARAKAILDLVAQSPQPPHIADITRALGLPKSSVHGLCNTLADLGLLARREQGAFALGGHVMTWANAFAAKSDMIGSFLRLWDDMPELQDNTVTLSTLEGGDVTYIACKEGKAPLGITFRIGMHLPAAFTATGKAMLATYSDVEIATLYHDGLPAPLTRLSVRQLGELRQEIAQIRERGYSIDNGQVREGMVCFGAAITGFASPRAIGGIAVSVLEGETHAEAKRRMGELVRQFAERLSRALGG